MPDYMTTAEVADLVRAPVETVRYWHYVGRGPQSFKVGRRRLYERAEVLAWIEAARKSGGVDAA